MKKIFFSVCVPVFNVETYIGECIDSVLMQSYRNFELILVDDGSKDDSLKICREYELKNNCIKVFSKANEGQMATRNYAFSKVSGNVIVCLDSDDFLERNALEKLNEYFEQYCCDCIYFNWRRFCKNKNFNDYNISQTIELINDKTKLFKKILLDNHYNSMCLKAFKAEFIPKDENKEFYKIRHGEDLIETIEILDRANQVLFVPDILYNYRVNPQSVTYNTTGKLYIPNSPVKLFVNSFIKERNLFSSEDWNDYGKYCALLFFGNLKYISNLDVSNSEKISLLEQEQQSDYYIKFISFYKTGNLAKDFLLALFKRGYFVLLLVFLRVVIFLKSCFKS